MIKNLKTATFDTQNQQKQDKFNKFYFQGKTKN